jgi:hypothetical protein
MNCSTTQRTQRMIFQNSNKTRDKENKNSLSRVFGTLEEKTR